MAVTRSPLRILAVPVIPMLAARPCSSASRMRAQRTGSARASRLRPAERSREWWCLSRRILPPRMRPGFRTGPELGPLSVTVRGRWSHAGTRDQSSRGLPLCGGCTGAGCGGNWHRLRVLLQCNTTGGQTVHERPPYVAQVLTVRTTTPRAAHRGAGAPTGRRRGRARRGGSHRRQHEHRGPGTGDDGGVPASAQEVHEVHRVREGRAPRLLVQPLLGGRSRCSGACVSAWTSSAARAELKAASPASRGSGRTERALAVESVSPGDEDHRGDVGVQRQPQWSERPAASGARAQDERQPPKTPADELSGWPSSRAGEVVERRRRSGGRGHPGYVEALVPQRFR